MPLTNSKIIQQTKEIRKVQTSAFNIKINDVEAARLKGGGGEGHNKDLDWHSPFYRSK